MTLGGAISDLNNLLKAENIPFYYKPLIKKIIETIEQDAIEQKIGHWRDTGSGQECSECGEIQYGYDSFRNYCPNCGAKMESEG